MSRRTELPWDLINTQVIHAAQRFCKSQFMSSRQLARQIMNHPADYPDLINARFTMGARKQGWKEWSDGTNNGGKKVFVVPEQAP